MRSRSCAAGWRVIVFASVSCFASIGCGGNGSDLRNADTERRVSSAFQSLAKGDSAVQRAALSVQVAGQARIDLEFDRATSSVRPAARPPVFRSASVGKIITAATVLRLAELGKLALDDTLDEHLPSDLIAGLSVNNGIDRTNEITVRMLLTHTSGLADYFFDGATNPEELPPFFVGLLAEPDRLWSPEEPVLWCRENLAPAFEPGEGFHYSETGYQLLGLIVEAVTNKPFHTAARELVLQPLGMGSTSMEWREPLRGGSAVLPTYLGEMDLTSLRALSSEWAGGGWLTTGPDLINLLEGVYGGALFSNPATLALMTEPASEMEPGVGYGMGTMILRDGQGRELYGHTGFYGSLAFVSEDGELVVAGSFCQAAAQTATPESLLVALTEALAD